MGQVNSSTITSGSIVNGDISLGAGVSASKLQHQHVVTADWGYADTDGTVAVEDQTVFIASSTGTIREVKVWLVDSGTNTDIDFDIEVNGSTILTGDINVVNGTGDNVAVAGVINTPNLIVGDYITCVIKTVTQNTGATGPRMQITLDSTYV